MTFAADEGYCYWVCALYKLKWPHQDYFVSKIVLQLITIKNMRLWRTLYAVHTPFQAIYSMSLNPIALRAAKTLWSFGLSECNRVKVT